MINKNVFKLLVFVLIFSSCVKENILNYQVLGGSEIIHSRNNELGSKQNEKEPVGFYSFSKELKIELPSGASTRILIEGNNQKLVNSFDDSSIHFEVSYLKEEFENTEMLPNEKIESENIAINDSSFINLKIVDLLLPKGVNSFTLYPILNNIYRGPSFELTGYSVEGVYDIYGASVRYRKEGCSKEWVKVKLYKKTSLNNWFWQKVAEGKLYAVGDLFNYVGQNSWPIWKLHINFKKRCRRGEYGEVFPQWIVH